EALERLPHSSTAMTFTQTCEVSATGNVAMALACACRFAIVAGIRPISVDADVVNVDTEPRWTSRCARSGSRLNVPPVLLPRLCSTRIEICDAATVGAAGVDGSIVSPVTCTSSEGDHA